MKWLKHGLLLFEKLMTFLPNKNLEVSTHISFVHMLLTLINDLTAASSISTKMLANVFTSDNTPNDQYHSLSEKEEKQMNNGDSEPKEDKDLHALFCLLLTNFYQSLKANVMTERA